MSVIAPSVVPLFATPFGLLPLPDLDAHAPALATLFVERATPDRRAPGDPGVALSYRSRDDVLDWPEPPIQALRAAILGGVRAVVASLHERGEAQFESLNAQVRGWYTIVGPNGYVAPANYPNTAWCAIYCVAAPEPSVARLDSGVLRLHETRLGTMYADATNAETRMPYTPGHMTWRPVPGTLAVFPACVTHEIALVRSTGTLMFVTARVRYVGTGQTGLSRW